MRASLHGVFRLVCLLTILAAPGCIPKQRTLNIVFQNYQSQYQRMDLYLNNEHAKNISNATPCGDNTWCKPVTLTRISGEKVKIKVVGTLMSGEKKESNELETTW